MKERIVIKDDFWVKHFQEREKDFYEEDLCSGGNPEEWWHYKKEQVPETWEDLKELCKKLEPKLVKENNLYETQITLNINKGGYYAFYPDGTIIFKASNSINYTIAKNRTMLQMFQFIKSLIGEER